jgi:predicted tellurium resistance membrane protein TerC
MILTVDSLLIRPMMPARPFFLHRRLDMQDFFTVGTMQAVAIIAVLGMLLSVDNAFDNRFLAERLPGQGSRFANLFALGIGILFRVGMLYFGTVLIHKYPLVEIGAAAFLIYLTILHIIKGQREPAATRRKEEGIASVILSLIVLNLAFSVETAAVAIGFSEQFAVLAVGIICGALALSLAEDLVARFMLRYPSIERAVYLTVGVTILVTDTHRIWQQFPAIDISAKCKLWALGLIIVIAIIEEERRYLKLRRAKKSMQKAASH